MCGIVGLYLKNNKLELELGKHLTTMLIGMTERGPDSAGVAIYRDQVTDGSIKFSLFHPDEDHDWSQLATDMSNDLKVNVSDHVHFNHCVLVANSTYEEVSSWLARKHSEVTIVSVGDTMEIFKDMGLPEEVAARFGIGEMSGTHALGHTRMATESAVTTAHSHPFSTGRDLCLVHNGSLSNHNRLRSWLSRKGIKFQTDNDTEVAAGYFTYRMREGDSLKEAFEAGLKDLDGFYTFAAGTKDGFAVVRDGIACKPAVLAETDDYVAIASEFRSLSHLPGVDAAKIWEPKPLTVYSWGSA